MPEPTSQPRRRTTRRASRFDIFMAFSEVVPHPRTCQGVAGGPAAGRQPRRWYSGGPQKRFLEGRSLEAWILDLDISFGRFGEVFGHSWARDRYHRPQLEKCCINQQKLARETDSKAAHIQGLLFEGKDPSGSQASGSPRGQIGSRPDPLTGPTNRLSRGPGKSRRSYISILRL